MRTPRYMPGPWTVDGPPDNQIVWSTPENRVCFLAHTNGRDPERDVATGRLIAAAPELADACRPQLSAPARRLIEQTIEAEEAVGNPRVADALRFLLERQDAARAAIAKAEDR